MLKRKGRATGDETERPNSWEVTWRGEEYDVGYGCPLVKWGSVNRAEGGLSFGGAQDERELWDRSRAGVHVGDVQTEKSDSLASV
jgi:hypothetical protein